MAVSYTLNRFITAKISDVAFDITVAVIKGKNFTIFLKKILQLQTNRQQFFLHQQHN